MKKSPFYPVPDRRGAMMVLMVLCLPVILIFSAFAINIAWMQLTRTELRTATDAAARAGSRTLSLTQDPAAARTAAIDAAARNKVAGDGLLLAATDVEFGSSDPDANGKWVFTPQPETSDDLNGVRITGDRTTGSASGSVPMLFGSMLSRTYFEPIKSATASQLDRDVFLVLDRSGSMTRSTSTGTRWTDLKDAVQAFLDALESTPQDELVGIASYSSTSRIDEHMMLDYDQLMSTIDGIRCRGMTAIGRGLEDGIDGVLNPSYARPTAAKTIVIMTDGHHNRGVDPVDVAEIAYGTHGIIVHTITFSSGANQNHMRNVAAAGGGNHWHADDQEELIEVFEDVANNLPTLLTE